MISHIDQIYTTIQPEINAHYNRWKSDPSLVNFGNNITNIEGWVGYYINLMKNFANQRPEIAKNHIKSVFNLPNSHPITIKNAAISKGFVAVNENLKIQEFSWTGAYFETVPIQLTAIPEVGFEFSHWSGDLYSNDATININLNGSFQIIPNFTVSTSEKPLVINEINYKSSDDFNADDWIELYNPNVNAKDLSNWQIKDNKDDNIFIIPEGTVIPGDGYLVFVKDASDFSSAYPEITNYIGEIGFGFGTSDAVRLFNANNVLQDEVNYTNELPWSDCADQTGNTLELTTPDLDNALPESWSCNTPNGSPNAKNTSGLSFNEFVKTEVKVYPNPVQNELYISGVSGQFKVQIYALTGQEVRNDTNTFKLNVRKLKRGMYFLKISEGSKNTLLKFIKY